MKALVSALVLLVLATASFAAGWTSSGPTGGAVRQVIAAPSDPDVIWAGNTAGVFRSTDGGATWANVSGPVVDVRFMVVHPTDPNRAWVLTGDPGFPRLYRTLDGGATWIDSTGLPSIRPSALLIDPRNPDTLYVGSHCGVIFSFPQWHDGAGVFRSTDAGVTWKPVAGLDGIATCAEELSIDPFSPWRLFMTGPFSDFGGYRESYDAANTWDSSKEPRPGLGVVFDPRYPFTHYGISARLGSLFMVSQDGGFTWSRLPGTLPSTPTSISMDPERSRIFVGTLDGVLRSGNGGRSWANTNAPDVPVTSISFGGTPRSLFAASSAGLLRLTNRGLGLPERMELNDISVDIGAIAVDPKQPSVVYAATRGPQIYRSNDAGASWQRLPGDGLFRADQMTVDGGGTLYAASSATARVYRYDRDQATWIVIRDGTFLNDLEADPKNAGVVFTYGSGSVFRSRDGGASWLEVLEVSGPGQIAIDPSDPGNVYVGNDFTLFRSTDGGTNWRPLLVAFDGTRQVAVAPSDGSILYRIVSKAGFLSLARSNDRGETWTPIPLAAYPTDLAVDPHDALSVYAGAGGGIYHSTDGGATWQKVEGPFAGTPRELRLDPTGRVLHAVFPQHGVWELTVE